MFQIRAEQYAELRRKKIGDALIGRLTPLGVDAKWDQSDKVVVAEDAIGSRTRIDFDSFGFVGALKSPLGRTWEFSNLKDGKPAQLLSPSGYEVGMRYDAEGRLAVIGSTTRQPIQLRYTEKEQLAAVGFADRTWELIEYTPSGKPSALTSRLGTKTTLGYDAQERLTSITDPNGNSTRFAYSRWSRPDSTHFADGTKEFYRYDANGCVSRIVQGDVAIDLKCNDKGRPLELRYSDGTEVTHAYDDGGRIEKAAVGELVTAISYDDRGQSAEETSGTDSHKFDYDELGRLIRIASGDGESVEYSWDADSRLVGFKDWNGGVHRIDYPWGDTGEAITGANGVHTLNERDAAGKVTRVSVTASGKSLYSLACSYDGEERLTAARDSIFGQHSYAYDAEGRVVASELSDKREFFRYDPAGNPTQIDGLATRVDEGNRLLSVGDEVLSYDLRGNLTGRSGPGGDWLYSYNARNQMVAVVSPTGERTAYSYDGFGRRISKRTPKTETRFVWAGESLLAEISTDRATGKVSRRDFLYKPGTFVPLAMRVDGKVYSYHTDNLGTPRAVTSPDCRVVWAAELSAFGKTKLAVESVRNPLRFPGQYFDEETGLHYNRFRYYLPELGRYITRDPMGFVAGSNFYTYVDADPVNRCDPIGLFSWKSALVVVASVAVAAAVIALAPVALPLAILAAGAAAVAVGAGLNQALNEEHFCLPCILKAAGDAVAQYASGVAEAIVPMAIMMVMPPPVQAAMIATAVTHLPEIWHGMVATGSSALNGDPHAIGQLTAMVAVAFVAPEGEGAAVEEEVGAAPEEVVTVYRVEGAGNQRLIIDASGNVEIPEVLTKTGAERNLYLNFGNESRADQFLDQRLPQFPDNTIKSFEVPKSFLDDLRANAVPEAERSANPTSPVIADPTKAADQFGLSEQQIDQLRKVIIQGSGN